MSIESFQPIPVEVFGSWMTLLDPSNVPLGLSPALQDVEFFPGGVRTRPGLLAVFPALANGVQVNGLESYITTNLTQRLLVLDSLGNLYKETSPGSLALVASGLANNAYLASRTHFGREYMAFSDGITGADMPRQFDDTNFDRVSQVGPGEGPAAADAVATLSAIARASNVVTVTTATPHNLLTTDQVTIAGVADPSYNGTFPVASIASATQFTYAQTAANSSSSGGTAAPVGNVSPGAHQCAVIFVTRQGYWTAPSPPVTWTAAGGRKVTVNNIPTGPANIVARLVAFTAAGGASFFQVPTTMTVNDNATTSLTVDFSEAILLSGVNVDYLFKLIELPNQVGVIDYAERMFWWGERGKMQNWRNLTFDGGWDPSGNGRPLGWQLDPTSGAGGSREPNDVAWGAAYRITGNGTTAIRGMITQGAVADLNGVALVAKNTDYSVRARVKRSAGLTQGTLHMQLHSASAALDTVGLTVTAAQASTQWAEFVAQLTPPQATIPADLVLRVYADGTPGPNGESFLVDNIESFPTAQPVSPSLVRASRTEQPESFDGVNGILSVAENNGQAIRAAFKLRQFLYFVKERSLHVTADDGVNEPSLWSLEEVSNKIGTPSVHGVGVGEEWVVIASRAGLYYFDGGQPQKLSQEIQPTWDAINWQYGHRLWVQADVEHKRILVGVPMGAATQPNQVLVLDYTEGFGDPIWTMLWAPGRSRKWAPWNIAANSCGLIERSTGVAQVFLGNNAGNGKIYQLAEGQYSDDGAAIASNYRTAFLSATGATGRNLFGYLTSYVQGAGTLAVSAYLPGGASVATLGSLALASPAPKDFELMTSVLAERVSYQVGTSAAGAWFSITRLVPWAKPDPWALVRGTN